MKNDLLFDFLVDKDKSTITVKREFKANRQLVWDAYTKRELLEQWFAPKPFITKTKFMDFREGGYWLYAMVEPTGKEYWGRMDYMTIRPMSNYTGIDAFCHENGEINADLPQAHWNVTFTDEGSNSVVTTIVTYQTLADLETVIKMGMEEGLALTLDQLDNLLLTLTN